MKVELGDKVKVTVQGKDYEGEVINISYYRPPDMRIVVDVEDLADYLFVGEEDIKEVIG